MKTIILDTNILLQDTVNVFKELERICDFSYHIAILDKTLEELKNKKGEKFAQEFISKTHIKAIRTNSPKIVDDILLERAPEEQWIVVTQDKALKQALTKKNVEVITIRQQKTLIFVNKHVL